MIWQLNWQESHICSLIPSKVGTCKSVQISSKKLKLLYTSKEIDREM